jgi:hypothetical protein
LDTKIRVSPEYFLLLLLTYTIFAEKIKYMRIDIITVLPEMIEGFFNCSIMKRAQNKGLAEIHIHNLRDYTEDKYRRVDDYPFGGFAGMVMKIEPIERCIMNWKDAVEFMLAGASAIQIGTANFIDPAITVKVAEGIDDYLNRHGYKSVKEIIGALEV